MHQSYRLTPTCTLTLVRGSILAMAPDAIVAAAGQALAGGGGVEAAIHDAGGEEFTADCRRIPETSPGVRCPAGEARMTTARGSLRARYVIHAVGPRHEAPTAAALLESAHRSAFALADAYHLRTLALSAIGCGSHRYPPAEAAAIALHACGRYAGDLERIWVALPDEDVWCAWRAEATRVALPAIAADPAVMRCPTCAFRVTGLRCRGMRSPAPQVRFEREGYRITRSPDTAGVALPVPTSGCGALLEWDRHGELLVCPRGCGAVSLHCEPKHDAMTAERGHAPDALREAIAVEHAKTDDGAPLLTCTRCGLSVDGALCWGDAHADRVLPLPRNGFFERVACAYVWSCERGCARKPHGGGLLHGRSLTCTCAAAPMEPTDYVERHGPPQN